MWISALFGIVLIVLLQCMTRKIVHWIFILGSLTFIALGITIFMYTFPDSACPMVSSSTR